MKDTYEELIFLDDDGPSDVLPSFVSTTNARDLFGLREGETVLEAIARQQALSSSGEADKRA